MGGSAQLQQYESELQSGNPIGADLRRQGIIGGGAAPAPSSGPDFGTNTSGTINGMQGSGAGMVGPPTQPGPGQATPLGGMLSSPPPTGAGTVSSLSGALGGFGQGGPPTQPGPGQGMPGMVGPPTQPFGGGQTGGMSLFGSGQQNPQIQALLQALMGGQSA